MYNLFVSYSSDSWNGEPWQIDISRCVREYTDGSISERLGKLDGSAVSELMKLPCIFAYETAQALPPKFGILRAIAQRQGEVRVEYEIQQVEPFLAFEDFEKLRFELDIGKWEMNRTHWAVKDVNLPRELHAHRGIDLPSWAQNVAKAVDITTHTFEVALSFPGEIRTLVEKIAKELEKFLGPNSYFYDENYVSQLARPSLDVLLQDIYRNRSNLVVVFVGQNYQAKPWCGIELRAVKDIILEREHDRIMFIRTDDGAVDGVFKTDGFIDARRFSPEEIARFILERLGVLKKRIS
jgi:hypothetical protein